MAPRKPADNKAVLSVLSVVKDHRATFSSIGKFLFFVLSTVPGIFNSYTGLPFQTWLQQKGINMPCSYLFIWVMAFIGFIFLLWKDRKYNKRKFSVEPWIYTGILALILLFETTRRDNQYFESAAKSMIINTNSEAIYAAADGDSGAMWQQADIQFHNHNYIYCALLLKNAYKIISLNDPHAYVSYPYYAASVLAVNPTPEGRIQFHELLDGMISYINFARTSGKGIAYYRSASVLRDMAAKMREIKALLPESDPEQIYCESIRTNLIGISDEQLQKGVQ